MATEDLERAIGRTRETSQQLGSSVDASTDIAGAIAAGTTLLN